MSRYPTIPEMEFGLELENLATHECEFSRGYWAGRLIAKLEDGVGFECSIPSEYLDELTQLVEQRDGKIEHRLLGRNRFGVPFASIQVVQREGEHETLQAVAGHNDVQTRHS